MSHVTRNGLSLASAKNGATFLLRHILNSSTNDSCGVKDVDGTESMEIEATPMVFQIGSEETHKKIHICLQLAEKRRTAAAAKQATKSAKLLLENAG